MYKKNTKNILFMSGGGFTPTLIPSQHMHKVGQTPSGVGIYTASGDVLRTYYPDLYEQRPGASGYIFTGDGTTFTPSRGGDRNIDKYVDVELLKRYTPGYTPKEQNSNNHNTTNNVGNNIDDDYIYMGPEAEEVVVTPENGSIDYGDNLSTWGNGKAVNAYNPDNPYMQYIMGILGLYDLAQGSANPLANGWDNSWNALDFMNIMVPTHLVSPTNWIGAAGEALRKDNENFFLNVLSGKNKGIFSLSQGMEDWSNRHPYWATAANFLGDAAALKFIPRIPRLLPKGLEKVGSWNVGASNWAARGTNALGARALSAVEGIPGGSRVTGLGRGALNTGRSVLSSAQNYGNRALQYIPLSIRQWSSNAAGKVRDVATAAKLENVVDRGLQYFNNGAGLSDLGKLGVKLGKTAWGVGSTVYGLGTGDEDADWTDLGKATKYVPGLTRLYNVSNAYSKYKGALKAVDNVENMFSEGVTPKNALNVVEGTIGALSKDS